MTTREHDKFNKSGAAICLLTKHFSLAALTFDAIAVTENVEAGCYHDYQHRNKVEKQASLYG